MKTSVLVLLVLLGCVAPARAADPDLTWSDHRPIADWISTGLVGVQLTADTIHSFKADERRHAFLTQACRISVAIGVSELGKAVIHRQRPDGSDWKSFPSEHTAIANAASGWQIGYGRTIAVGAGYGRIAAAKHHLSDVVVGFGVGELSKFLCNW